ncbi:MAG: ABC transporter permease [Deltaproteobacteria bacterium]
MSGTDASVFAPVKAGARRRRRKSLLSVRDPLSPRAHATAGVLAFIVPLVLWCVLSYVPFLWHPQVLVEDAGDSAVPGQYAFVASGQRVDREVFDGRNAELTAAGRRLASGERVNPIFLPAPHEVARAFYTAFTSAPERTGDFWLHESLLHSCTIILLGFLYSMLIGIPVGLLCGTFSLFSRLIEPFVDFVRYMPAPVFGALAVSVLGLGDEPKITIIFIGTFFQAVLVVANTTRSVDFALIQAAQTLGANHRQLLLRVIVPAALPALYRDMRILLGWAWTYLVVAELIGEKSGISAFLYQQQRYRHFENVYAGIVMIGMIGLITDQVLAFLGQYLFPWESGKPSLLKLVRGLRRQANASQAAVSSSPSVSS